jgi:hypothetical protein
MLTEARKHTQVIQIGVRNDRVNVILQIVVVIECDVCRVSRRTQHYSFQTHRMCINYDSSSLFSPA